MKKLEGNEGRRMKTFLHLAPTFNSHHASERGKWWINWRKGKKERKAFRKVSEYELHGACFALGAKIPSHNPRLRPDVFCSLLPIAGLNSRGAKRRENPREGGCARS